MFLLKTVVGLKVTVKISLIYSLYISAGGAFRNDWFVTCYDKSLLKKNKVNVNYGYC